MAGAGKTNSTDTTVPAVALCAAAVIPVPQARASANVSARNFFFITFFLAKLEPVTPEVAQTVIAKANEVVGAHTFIASIVDLQVPEGTGRAEFTLGRPHVWKGQKVTGFLLP